MTSSAPAHTDEFDVVAGWTAQALAGRDRHRSIAGSCNGSCSPAALAWLAESLRLEPGGALLDVGCGLGGALAWAEDRFGVRGIGVEPMPEAVAGSAALFGHRSVRASADALPFATGVVPSCWMLGVLDTVPDAGAALREARRVVADDGRVGLLAYVATAPIAAHELPDGNHFDDERGLLRLLGDSGFVVLDRCECDELPQPPLDWRLEREHATAEVERAHGGEAAWSRAERQRSAFATLLDHGRVRPILVHAACL